MFKNFVQKKIEKYVRKYFNKHPEVKLVVVAGSVGKTSTKIAVATVLSEKFRVRLHEGNHNTHISAPLAMLGIDYPSSIKNPFAWLQVFRAARKRIKKPADVDVVVQELGADGIGDVAHFGNYLNPDIAVVTSVTVEHMEFFQSIENVAQEELSAANFSKLAIINRDDIDGKFASFLTNPNITTYGTSGAAEYRFVGEEFTLQKGHKGKLIFPDYNDPVPASITVVGEHNLRPAMAAATVGVKFGMSTDEIVDGLAKVRPVAGRMNILRGVSESILIDDSYNSSPLAASSALQTLYQLEAPQRIAILGSMNELGSMSAAEHENLGKMCDPNMLAWVITVGEEAEKHLAPAARAKGCQVKSFRSALEAGAFAHKILERGAIVLGKGSQGDIYIEEALKVLLHSADDDKVLVRQSPAWMKVKNAYFSRVSSLQQ